MYKNYRLIKEKENALDIGATGAAGKATGARRQDGSTMQSAKEFFKYIKGDAAKLMYAFVFVLLNSAAGVITPFLIAKAIDTYIAVGDLSGLLVMVGYLALLYAATAAFGYAQGILVGSVSQRTLFRLRSELFKKLQELPIAFFNQNKAGDLMSRLNNDTNKLNQFLSESITRFVGSFFVIFGIGAFALVLNWKLGLVMLSATAVLVLITRVVGPYIERANKNNLNTVGELSSSLQENLTNFRVVVAYGKRDYFKSHIQESNKKTFDTSFRADVANRVLEPIYDFAGAAALILVLLYGMHLVSLGQITIGILVAFVSYTEKFYSPLRILATIFGSIELSLAAWSRIRAIFNLESDLVVYAAHSEHTEHNQHAESTRHTEHDKPAKMRDANKAVPRLEFSGVSFGYKEGQAVIDDANFAFEAGKTYALVGPTGGGKSTIASLMSRLYDPISGGVYLDGKDLKTFSHEDRARDISVILQDPILFTGTVGQNIIYGNTELQDQCNKMNDSDMYKKLEEDLDKKGFKDVISRFANGLSTFVSQGTGAGLSLGQKQLISFMRAVLREPKLLILDEATANIDTITEAMLGNALHSLPKDTTKVIIAHRLNTIKEADEILFVNSHHVTKAGNFDEAVELISNAKRGS